MKVDDQPEIWVPEMMMEPSFECRSFYLPRFADASIAAGRLIWFAMLIMSGYKDMISLIDSPHPVFRLNI